ncbi:hypothetical protein, partial [Caballeronia temeraria]|uniref:hypothetical protein n=1 Tax=Caballeronia temeraria TaxID=1777137 RepID=UPI000A4545EF
HWRIAGEAASWNEKAACPDRVRDIGVNGNQQRVCHAIKPKSGRERSGVATLVEARLIFLGR